jgi:hypothetical protein
MSRPQYVLTDLVSAAIVGAAREIVSYIDSIETPPTSKTTAKKAISKTQDPIHPPESSAPPATTPQEQSPAVAAPPAPAPEEAIVVDGVPVGHPIHAEVAALLPAFRTVSKLVSQDNFEVTPSSAELALPVWVAFNALSKYRSDSHFSEILSYVRTYIKPVCFAAMGKEVAK